MSFAVILFGTGKSIILNTNCRNCVLLQTLKRSCQEVCDEDDEIDVADESGEVKYLCRCLEAYANESIAPRERLILLRVDDPKQQDVAPKFFPLLQSAQNNKTFMTNLNQPGKARRNKLYAGLKTAMHLTAAMSAAENNNPNSVTLNGKADAPATTPAPTPSNPKSRRNSKNL